MRKKVLIGLSAVFAAAFGLSCTDDETGPWKDYDLSVTSNIASGNGNVPYEGATVVFTVTTDGRWTYVTDDSAGWLGQSAVDGITLAVVVPENTVSKERSGQIKFISVSDPTLVETVTRRKPPSPRRPKPTCWTWFFTLTVRPKTFRR